MRIVTPQQGAAWCHLYDDSLKVIGKLHAGERAIVLPLPTRRTSWHLFVKVVTLDGSGWVEAGAIEPAGGET